MSAEKTWLDYLAGIGATITPILVLSLSGLGWRFKKSLERRQELEEKLRTDRIETYNQMLEPFVIMLTSKAAWESDNNNKGKDQHQIATSKLLSLEYRKTSFKMALLGSDNVVMAYNNLMQFFFAQEDIQSPDIEKLKTMLSLLGTFLLEIRKSMGNESTKLSNWQMLEWFIADARKLSNA